MPEQLFVSLYLDEDVHIRVAQLIRSRGFSAMTTLEAGRLTSDDPAQLAYAAEHGMAIMTHNRTDFEDLAVEYFKAQRTHGGIIIAHRRTPRELADRVLRILNDTTADEMRNQLRYI